MVLLVVLIIFVGIFPPYRALCYCTQHFLLSNCFFSSLSSFSLGFFDPLVPHAIALNNFFVIFVEIVIFVSSVDLLLLLVIFAIFVLACNPGHFSMIYASSVPSNRTKALMAQLGRGDNF